jgi:cold shock CspA family protein
MTLTRVSNLISINDNFNKEAYAMRRTRSVQKERGVITFYDFNRNYGFIRPDRDLGGRVFFFIDNFVGKTRGFDRMFSLGISHLPDVNDRVIFRVEEEEKGLAAYEIEYDGSPVKHENVANTVDSKVNLGQLSTIRYRVRQELEGRKRGWLKTLWEGTDVDELNKIYPRSKNRKRDPLNSPINTSDGEQKTWFERCDGANWVPARDPRPMP